MSRQKLPAAAYPWVFAAIMGSVMTALVTAVLTFVRGGDWLAWVENWGLACLIAIPTIFWLAPRARAWAAQIAVAPSPTTPGPRR